MNSRRSFVVNGSKCGGGVNCPVRICLAVEVVPNFPRSGRRVVIGGVSLVCRYFLSLAARMACSTDVLSR